MNSTKLRTLLLDTIAALESGDRQTIRAARWPALKSGYGWLEGLIQMGLQGEVSAAAKKAKAKLAEVELNISGT